MQADDVRALRQSAVPTACVGVLCAVVGGLAAGGKGVLGALLGLAVVTVFFMISTVVVGRAARISPQALMVSAMVSYLVKVVALILITAQFTDTTLFNGRAFGFTAIACVLTWSATQVRTWMRSKIFYVEPVSQGPVVRDPVGKL
jgi:ATP synthase protein I